MIYTIQDLTDGKVAFFLEESTTPEQLKEVLTKAFPDDWFCKGTVEEFRAYMAANPGENYYKSIDPDTEWRSSKTTKLPTTSINTFLVKLEHGKWYKENIDSTWILKYDETVNTNTGFFIGYFDYKFGKWSGFGYPEQWTLATKEDLTKLGNEWEPYWEEPYQGLPDSYFVNNSHTESNCVGTSVSSTVSEHKVKEFESLSNEESNCESKSIVAQMVGAIDEMNIAILKQAKLQEKLIRRFPSGAVRSNNEGRPRPDWISPYAIEEISKVMVSNENDFGACNYMLGIPETECLESLCRHVEELKEAILIKKDMNEAKVIARSVGFNSIALIHTLVLKERNLYKEIYNQTEVISVEEAKQGNNFTDK